MVIILFGMKAARKETFRWQLVANREVSGSRNVTDPIYESIKRDRSFFKFLSESQYLHPMCLGDLQNLHSRG